LIGEHRVICGLQRPLVRYRHCHRLRSPLSSRLGVISSRSRVVVCCLDSIHASIPYSHQRRRHGNPVGPRCKPVLNERVSRLVRQVRQIPLRGLGTALLCVRSHNLVPFVYLRGDDEFVRPAVAHASAPYRYSRHPYRGPGGSRHAAYKVYSCKLVYRQVTRPKVCAGVGRAPKPGVDTAPIDAYIRSAELLARSAHREPRKVAEGYTRISSPCVSKPRQRLINIAGPHGRSPCGSTAGVIPGRPFARDHIQGTTNNRPVDPLGCV